MSNIKQTYTTYLALLTGSLHKGWSIRPNFSLTSQEWFTLFQLAHQQATIGVCYPVLSSISKEQLPPQSLNLQWAAQANFIQIRNKKMRQVIGELQSLFAEADVIPIVMKGLSFAINYPQPNLRMSGDIDLFIPQRYKEVIALLQSKGYEVDYSEQHYALTFQGIRVELHHRVINSPFKEISSYNIINAYYDGLDFKAFDIETQAVLLLTHAADHLVGPGISFRFLYDWATFLLAHGDELNTDSFRKQIKHYHLTRFAEVFTTAASELLGIPHPAYIKENRSFLLNSLIQDMFTQGDCGQMERRKRLQRNKVVSSGMGVFRLLKFIPYSPYIAWNALWMHFIKNTSLLHE